MYRISIYEARNNLSEYVRMAEQGKPVELTRYNKPVAVIISYSEYQPEEPTSKKSWLTEWREKNAEFLDDEGIPLQPKVYPAPKRKIFD